MNIHHKINFFLLSPSSLGLPETWTENGKQYLLFWIFNEVVISNPKARQKEGEKTKNHVFLVGNKDAIIPYLIVPDDNSFIISQIKNRKENDIFITSLENLQFKHNFMDEYQGKGRQPAYANGFLVRDTNQLAKKVSDDMLFPEITFKVVGQRKTGFVIGTTYEKSFFKYGSYKHELEIEPLNLGIKGMPSITKIIFNFADSLQISLYTELTKSKLYKSNILTNSVGKTFTMRVIQFNLVEKNTALSFSSDHDFEWGSFQEKMEENNNKKQPNSNQPGNSDQLPDRKNGSKHQSNTKNLNTLKKILLASGILIVLISIIFALLYFWKRKNSSNE